MNFFRFIADLLHLVSFLILIFKIRKSMNVVGTLHTLFFLIYTCQHVISIQIIRCRHLLQVERNLPGRNKHVNDIDCNEKGLIC